MINRLSTYKVRAEKLAEARDALKIFAQAAQNEGPEGFEIAIFCEKDGLTHHHYASFPDKASFAQHIDSTYLADFWESLYACCETFSQSVELELLHSINK
jgi:hypothetical protein